MKIRIGVLLSVTGTSLLFSCGPKAAQVQAQTAIEQGFCINDQLKQSTEIIDVTEQPISEQLTRSGKIEYNENDMVAFRTLLDGWVVSEQFELGEYVRTGACRATMR